MTKFIKDLYKQITKELQPPVGGRTISDKERAQVILAREIAAQSVTDHLFS